VPSILNFDGCLTTDMITPLMECVQEMTGLDKKTGDVRVVGMPAMLTWIIQECKARKIDDIVCNPAYIDTRKQAAKHSLDNFLSVYRRRWKYIISTNAEIARGKKLF
jgi:NAD(P)H-flavin reductase